MATPILFRFQRLLSLFLLIFLLIPTASFADDDVFTIVIKKQEQKEEHRWNLYDWLKMKREMRMQDLWLALHTKAPPEYFFEANYQYNQRTFDGSVFEVGEYALGANSKIFGLEGRIEVGPLIRIHGIFGIRFMGRYDQGTNLTFQLGVLHTETPSETYRQGLIGTKLTIYLAQHIGLQGLYRFYFRSTPSSGGQFTGTRVFAGAFIDFRLVRLYGRFFRDQGTQAAEFTGGIIGTKIYF